MKLVLTHTGSAVPDYTEICIRQAQFTNPGIDIDLIAEYNHGVKFVEKYNLKHVHIKPIEDIEQDYLVKRFREVSWLKAWGKPPTTYPSPENFVQGTSERLFLLAAYLKSRNQKDVWHIENDNLIYGSFEEISQHLNRNRVTCCYMGPKYTVWNLVFTPEPRLLYEAMRWYVERLAEGNDHLCKSLGIDMVHEMTVMSQYGNLSFLPSLPNEGTIEGYYFDPASYGQYIGGTNNGHPPGFRDTVNHDIGRSFGTLWSDAYFDGKAAFVVGQDNAAMRHIRPYPLFNLHVHNKFKMKELSTYE